MLVSESVIGNFLHQRAMWAPRIVVRGFSDFSFNFCVVHHNVRAKRKKQNRLTICNRKNVFKEMLNT